jgi:hypothetical protein
MTIDPEQHGANDHDDSSSPNAGENTGVSSPDPAEGADDAPDGDDGSPDA